MQPGLSYTGLSTIFLCHDGQDNFLFAKRSKNARDEHGRWDCGGGAVEFGTEVLDSLKREIKEEYHTTIKEYHYLGYRDVHHDHDGKKSHWVTLDFLVMVDRDQVKNNEPDKFDKIGWFKLDGLPSPLHSQFPHFLQKYRNKIAKLTQPLSS